MLFRKQSEIWKDQFEKTFDFRKGHIYQMISDSVDLYFSKIEGQFSKNYVKQDVSFSFYQSVFEKIELLISEKEASRVLRYAIASSYCKFVLSRCNLQQKEEGV